MHKSATSSYHGVIQASAFGPGFVIDSANSCAVLLTMFAVDWLKLVHWSCCAGLQEPLVAGFASARS
jgi:hypothetical protein